MILDRLAASWMTINNQLRRDINRQGERISDLEAENKAMGVRNSELKFKHKGEMRGLAKQLDTNMETFTNDHKKRHYNDLQKLKKQHQKNLSELNEEHMARINYKDECLARVRNTQEFMENSIKRLQEKLAEMETSAALMENRLVEKEASVVVLRNTRERMEAIIAGLHIKLEELGLGYCELYGPAASKLNKED